MLNLRARQYEPAMMRFSQPDIVRGSMILPQSLNRYAYALNNPVAYSDPSGKTASSLIRNIATAGKKIVGAVSGGITGVVSGAKAGASGATGTAKVIGAITGAISGGLKGAKAGYIAAGTSKTIAEACKAGAKAGKGVGKQAGINARDAVKEAQAEIKKLNTNSITYIAERNLILKRACAKAIGAADTAAQYAAELAQLRQYTEADWVFLAGDALFDETTPMSSRCAILEVLKQKSDITAEDLITIGVFTPESRYYTPSWDVLGWFTEDVAGEMAALLELSYRLSREGTTVAEMNILDMQERQAQQEAFMRLFAASVAITSAQAYSAAGSAIRMNGASIAAPGYESVPSDFEPFIYEGTSGGAAEVTDGVIEGGGSTVYTEAQQAVRDGNTAVIGKMRDLNAPNNVGAGEFKVADYLPDMGNPQANWNQNSGVLRSVMNENMPIKDVSPFPMDNAGFLGAERNLLQNAGWYYFDGYWYPPGQ